MTFVTITMLVLSVTPLFVHDEFRIIGTVTKQQDSAIDVKTKEGKTISIALNKQTLISRDKKKVSLTELKTGRYVVVDALGDSEADLLALEVRLVPPPSSGAPPK
jgi:hypothetical protein